MFLTTVNILEGFNHRQLVQRQEKSDAIPNFGPGDNVNVYIRIREGEKERIQRFDGLCIGRRNAGIHSSFRVRRISGGHGMERVFPLYSALIQRIECTRRGKIRRAKLYYIRHLSRKKSRIKERVVHDRSAAKN